MCAIIVKQCILHGKYSNSLTFIAQKTADETPQGLTEKELLHLCNISLEKVLASAGLRYGKKAKVILGL
jgi:hypothetical protein